MKHEFLYLNERRQYVLCDNETWYDADTGFYYSEGDSFLVGKVVRAISYYEYVEQFPEVLRMELKSAKSDHASGIFMRCVRDNEVVYNYDPRRFVLGSGYLTEDLND